MNIQNIYPSKLLLFGEYTVLAGSGSLAIPFHRFSLRTNHNGQNNFTGIIRQFHDYLNQQDFSEWNLHFQANRYKEWFEKGNYYSSDIPTGYGVGSSGSISAAVYDLFFKKSDQSPGLTELKAIFSCIECFFHGNSSGIDPLIIFLNESIYGKPDGIIEQIELDHDRFDNLRLLLLDSGTSRLTGKYVQIFQQKCQNPDYVNKYIKPLSALNETIIQFLVNGNPEIDLFDTIKKVSEIQFRAFREMIPDPLYKLWEQVLRKDEHVIKLCGAGGGGFFYIFSKDPDSFASWCARSFQSESWPVIHTGLFKTCE